MKTLLSINTVTDSCSVSLMKNKNIFSLSIFCPHRHTKFVFSMIFTLLKNHNINLSNLDGIIISNGPGNFTGIRIGISIAQGLTLYSRIPIIVVSSLATLAQGTWRKQRKYRVLTAIDAKMGEIYWGEYIFLSNKACNIRGKEVILSISEANEKLLSLHTTYAIAGNAWKLLDIKSKKSFISINSNRVIYPESEDMIPLAIQYLESGGQLLQSQEIIPNYLRKNIFSTSHIKLSKSI